MVLDNYALECITPEYTQGRAMGCREEVREMIAQLEQQRSRLKKKCSSAPGGRAAPRASAWRRRLRPGCGTSKSGSRTSEPRWNSSVRRSPLARRGWGRTPGLRNGAQRTPRAAEMGRGREEVPRLQRWCTYLRTRSSFGLPTLVHAQIGGGFIPDSSLAVRVWCQGRGCP